MSRKNNQRKTVANNRIFSSDIGLVNYNNENITLTNNTIYCLFILPMSEPVASVSTIYLIPVLVAIITISACLINSKSTKKEKFRKQEKKKK